MSTKNEAMTVSPNGQQTDVRRTALTWWNSITFEEQFYKTIAWLKSQNRNTTERHPHHLTGREIQQIYELHYA